jgi:hypothetical protein
VPVGTADDEDFELYEPAIPVDEDAAPAAVHGTRKLETTLEELPGKTQPAPAAKTTPAPPAKSPQPAKSPPPAKSADDKGEPTVDFSKWKDDTEENEPVKVDEDDDLGEFLKRLGK